MMGKTCLYTVQNFRTVQKKFEDVLPGHGIEKLKNILIRTDVTAVSKIHTYIRLMCRWMSLDCFQVACVRLHYPDQDSNLFISMKLLTPKKFLTSTLMGQQSVRSTVIFHRASVYMINQNDPGDHHLETSSGWSQSELAKTRLMGFLCCSTSMVAGNKQLSCY